MNTAVSCLNTNWNFTAKSRDSRVFHSKCVAQVDIFAPTASPTGSPVTHAQSFFSSVSWSEFMLGMRTWLPCHIPDRWSRNANWIWPDPAFGFVHKRSGNKITKAILSREGMRKSLNSSLMKKLIRIEWVSDRHSTAYYVLRHPWAKMKTVALKK